MTTENFTRPSSLIKVVTFLFGALIFMLPQSVNAQCTVSLENDESINICKHDQLPLNSIALTGFDKPLIMWKITGKEHTAAFDKPGSASPILYGINEGDVEVSVSVREMGTTGSCVGQVISSDKSITLNVLPKPEAVLLVVRSGNSRMHAGEQLSLEGIGENINAHSWVVEPSITGNPFSSTDDASIVFTAPTETVKKTYTITYTGTSEYGCDEQAQITITVLPN